MAEKQKSIEAFALARVPKEQRKSWIDMVMVQAGMVICIPAFLLGIMLLGTFMAFRTFGAEGLTANEVAEPTMSMIEGVGLAFSFFSASAFTAADLTRFQRNRKDTVKSAAWGLLPAGVITCVIGVVLSRVAGVYDISQVMAMVGLPVLGLTIMILAQLTTNSINAYAGGLDLIFRRADCRCDDRRLLDCRKGQAGKLASD